MPPGKMGIPGVTPVGSDAGGIGGPAIAEVAARATAAVPEAAAAVAADAGLDPNGPEMAALLKLSQDVIERIVWEVVPDLAEIIIRENLDKLTSQRH